jgi:hypothetical protein
MSEIGHVHIPTAVTAPYYCISSLQICLAGNEIVVDKVLSVNVVAVRI